MPLTPEEKKMIKLRSEENRNWRALRSHLPILRRISHEGPSSEEDLALIKKVFHTALAKIHLDLAERVSMDFIDGENESERE